ncbi:MAG TPA: TetR/AcrR family transcriptional regulator [Treponema sp.]|nr:TetR/AcrR family transcriptional regulator [Treponema sp.]
MTGTKNIIDIDLKKSILVESLEAFNQKGAKFTLDDLCKSLRISKKTIYTVFPGKEALLREMIDEGFRRVKEEEGRIFHDGMLSTIEKIKKIIIVIPDSYQRMDFRKFTSVKELYPEVYEIIVEHIEGGWDRTLELLEQGIQEGVLRKVSLPMVKTLIESAMEAFLLGKYPDEFNYLQALEEMMDIFMYGLINRENRV